MTQPPIVPGQSAQPPAAVQPAPPKPRFSPPFIAFMVGTLTLAALLFLYIGTALLGTSGTTESPASADVDVAGCTETGSRTFRVDLEVTNSTDRTASYRITVTVNWAGNRVGDGFALVPDVAPGETVIESVTVPISRIVTDNTSCRIADVDRS